MNVRVFTGLCLTAMGVAGLAQTIAAIPVTPSYTLSIKPAIMKQIQVGLKNCKGEDKSVIMRCEPDYKDQPTCEDPGAILAQGQDSKVWCLVPQSVTARSANVSTGTK